MNRKQFIQTTGSAALGLSLGWSCTGRSSAPELVNKNWAGNLSYHSREVLTPVTVDEVVSAVLKFDRVKALGSRHSFSTVADTDGVHISTAGLDKVLSLDREKGLVWCEAGVRYGTLATWLDERGFALHNMASLPHISVAGACATATHGSGDRAGNLSSAVRGMELVMGRGEVIRLLPDHPDFNGAVVHLGALGVVTKIALAVQPSYEVAQYVFEDLPMEVLNENFDRIFKSGYSVSLFTHWLDKKINQVWVKRRLDEKYEQSLTDFFGAVPASTHLHPIKVNSPVNCTDQMGIPGKWFERLPHFKMGFTPSNGEELQTEFFVSRENAVKAIWAVESLHAEVSPALFVTEIRSMAPDGLWLSPAYGRDTVAIHFTWKPEPDKVMAVIPKVEKVLEPFSPMPHWGKISTLGSAILSSRCSRLNDFPSLIHKYDPDNKFKCDFLDWKIFV